MTLVLDIDSLIRPAPIWDWLIPAAINDRGQIVGEAAWDSQTLDRIDRGILLTPLPPG